ncbi:AraC family transcriptional regulator [Mycobacterium tuberculosis]|uniref:AraC family transcriptional regulator n=1 Tax=Mycobacterium tuberculosis TaxID=1773 RepID=A0A655IXL1_MYCTX|nr:AraC family transcriptional regulator [Mycobacterium tuberculosis]COW40332.1 AraC family transcriptional regulator [Mycobacterium tuberculosis]SGO64485.1 AraC family transcriptional regulator [Mycobacterium tuberculosis]
MPHGPNRPSSTGSKPSPAPPAASSPCARARFLRPKRGCWDGHRATTHWAFAEHFAREFPAVRVDADPIFMRSSQKVWTAAGVTAGIDLALALVEDDHGTEIAQTVARWLVLYLRRPGGQTQFAAPVWMPRAKRTSIRRVQEAIEAEPGARTASANWLNVRP